ncbi:hypothetical protein KR018_011958 [Drosophila ironensis]|nr:hypothetical protein KR018_011958 [Drosophila ironensis]
MPPVKKPKAQKIENAGSPAKKKAVKKDVVSGQLSKKLKPQKENGPERGVILVKHLPHGFFEQQLRQYFKQFGNVLRLRLGRSERTGNSKGYAFVEFEYPEVAKVAAETMDNYLMFQKVVKAKYIPPEKQRSSFFKTTVKKVKNKAGKDIYVSKLTQSRQRSVNKHNDWDEAACQKRTVGTARKLRKLYDKYKDVDIPLLSLVVEPVKKTATEAEKENKKPAKKEQHKKQKQAAKKELQLEDLLGTTINDESDDEDYVEEAKPGKKQKLEAKKEKFLRSTIKEDSNGKDYQDNGEDLPSPPKKASKKISAAPVDKLKRKPGTGGVQKKKIAAPTAKVDKKAAAQKLLLEEALKLTKPKSKGKKSKK